MNTENVPCVPGWDSVFVDINIYNRGFPSAFLITKYWQDYPNLQLMTYIFGILQAVIALFGFYVALSRAVDPILYPASYASHKLLPYLTNLWQLAISGMIIALPTQWISNVTVGFILWDSYGEFFSLVLRFMLLDHNVNDHTLKLFYRWTLITIFLTAVPFMLGGNPYIQGAITSILVLPADFLNLCVAPILSYHRIRDGDLSKPDIATEVFLSTLNVVHVIWFYGQGLMACLYSVESGAQFYIAFQVFSTASYAGYVISQIYAIKQEHSYLSPTRWFYLLLPCCFSGTERYRMWREESWDNKGLM